MAITLSGFFDSKGSSVKADAASIAEAAALLLSPQGIKFQSRAGQSSPAGWANMALLKLQDAEAAKAKGDTRKYDDLVGEAHAWITGNKQPTRARNVWQTYQENRKSVEKKLQNELSNIANLTDFENANIPPEERARLQARANERLAGVQELISIAQDFGLSVNPQLTRTASGFIPTMDTQRQGSSRDMAFRTGEPTKVRRTANGFEVYGVNTGRVLGTAASESEAQALQLELTSGARGDVQGAYTGTTGTGSTGSYSGAGSEYVNALSENVNAKAAAAEAQGFTVTPEMRAMYLAQAQQELDPYYSEQKRLLELDTGTSFNRLIEDTRTSEARLARQYGQALDNTQGDLQSRGMLYGGVRQKTEQELADTFNQSFEDVSRSFNRSLEDISLSAEKQLGSNNMANYGTTRSVGRVIAGTPEFQLGSDTNVYRPTGQIYGEMPRSQTYSTQSRANELEGAERDRFSQFV